MQLKDKKAQRAERLESRRLARNRLRSQRGRQNRRASKAAARALRDEALAQLPPEQQQLAAQRAKQARADAQIAQDKRVRSALSSGLRVCIDLSFDSAMSNKETRQEPPAVQMLCRFPCSAAGVCVCTIPQESIQADRPFHGGE